MSREILLKKLTTATSPEQKAALVAESIIEDLPSNIRNIALWCGFLPWFTLDILSNFLGKKDDDIPIQKIANLPFVEKLSHGYCFHSTTRKGLLQKYRIENPTEIVSAFNETEKSIVSLTDASIQLRFLILYGYVITNQGVEAENLFESILKEGKIKNLDVFSDLNEAEELCISDNIGLTPKYWFYRSQFFLIENNYHETIRYCNKAISLDERYYCAYSTRGVAYAQIGNFDFAFRDVNYAIQHQPDELAFRSRASVYLLNEEYKNAIFDFTRAIRYNPKDVLAYLARSSVYLQNKKIKQALNDLDLALAQSDDSNSKLIAYINYARTLIIMEDWENALNYLDKAIQIEPTSGVYRRKADVLSKQTRLEEAKDYYSLALELDKQNPYAYLGRGKLYLRIGEYENAINDLKTAESLKYSTDLFPQNPLGLNEIHLRLWEIYLRIGEIELAKKQRSILLASKNKSQLSELIFFARKYESFDTMLDICKKLIEINSEKSFFQFLGAGYALNMLGKYEDAIGYLRKAEERSPKNILIKINMGMSYYGLRDMQSSIQYFEEANKSNITKPKENNFKSFKRKISEFSSDRIWIALMLGSSKSAIRSLRDLDQDQIGDLHDLRDWSFIINNFPENQPTGFDNFFELLNQKLHDYDRDTIYQMSWGI